MTSSVADYADVTECIDMAFKACSEGELENVWESLVQLKDKLAKTKIFKEFDMDKDSIDFKRLDDLLTEIQCNCNGGVMHNSRQALLNIKCLAIEAKQIINNDENGGDAA